MKCHFHLLLLFSQLLKQSRRIIADMESQYVVHCISEITAVTMQKSDPHYSKKYLRTVLNVCAHEHRLHSELCYLDIDILT